MSLIKVSLKYAFKDLLRQKIRTAVGILGVMISVGLLAVVLFLSDSISVTFIDYLSIDAGNQDMRITVRHYNGEPNNRSNYFNFQPIINTIETNYPDMGYFIPRFEYWGNVYISKEFNTTELTSQKSSVFISAINVSLEDKIKFGSFINPNTKKALEIKSLPKYNCLIYSKFNEKIKYSVNDTIEIRMSLRHGNVSYYRTQNFTVANIFDYQLKWPISYLNYPLIVINLEDAYSIFGNNTFTGKCNSLIIKLKNSEDYYDVRDLEASANRVKDLAARIQLLIGLEEYGIDLPKLEVLGYSEFLSVGITIIFVFVSMISTLISGVLINGILKTSVEERIREFGIFRTLGATKKFNLLIVFLQGFLLCNFGTILGIIGAQFSTQYVILPFAGNVVAKSIPGLAGNISFSMTIWSLIISYIMGIGVGLVVSISPAVRVMRLQLIESIHPYRHEDTLYHLQHRATINYKLILVGIILAANGAFVLLVIPRIIIYGTPSLISGTLIALLIIFLVGTTMAGLGLIPIVLRAFIQLFKIFSKKLAPVYKITIFRYARRNSSTIIIFAFTFSFVIFTSAAFTFLSNQVVVGSNLSYGSDLLIQTTGWKETEETSSFFGPPGGGEGFMTRDSGINLNAEQQLVDPNKILTSDFKQELLKIDGIEKVSNVIASPYHLTQVYSSEDKEFKVEIGDYAGLFTHEITLIGIDEEYPSTINTNYIEFTEGNLEQSFNELFNNGTKFTCIISEGIATDLNLKNNDLVRLVVQRGDESEIYTFRVVGIAAAMPGFFDYFKRSRSSAQMGGVMISDENYIKIMDIPPIPYLDKIFIKLVSNDYSTSLKIENQIKKSYQKYYYFDVINLKREIEQGQTYFSVLDTFFMITLDATIIICLFGLLSSSYSTIIERKKEIGIIRTLGLKGKELNRLFTIESLIIMLSSGTIGVIIGWLTGLLLSTSINLMSDLPNIPTFPIQSMINIFTISIIFTLIGMKILLKKLRKKKIVDIYRETQ